MAARLWARFTVTKVMRAVLQQPISRLVSCKVFGVYSYPTPSLVHWVRKRLFLRLIALALLFLPLNELIQRIQVGSSATDMATMKLIQEEGVIVTKALTVFPLVCFMA